MLDLKRLVPGWQDKKQKTKQEIKESEKWLIKFRYREEK